MSFPSGALVAADDRLADLSSADLAAALPRELDRLSRLVEQQSLHVAEWQAVLRTVRQLIASELSLPGLDATRRAVLERQQESLRTTETALRSFGVVDRAPAPLAVSAAGPGAASIPIPLGLANEGRAGAPSGRPPGDTVSAAA